MAKMKTEFKMEHSDQTPSAWFCNIIGTAPKWKPYVKFECEGNAAFFIPDKDIERFAVNILKALKSKHLSSPKHK